MQKDGLVWLATLFLIVGSSTLFVPIADSDDDAVRKVLDRLPAWISAEFRHVQVLRRDALSEGKVRIEVDEGGGKSIFAASTVDALYGINWVLRQHCFTQITWTDSSFGSRCAAFEPQVIQLEAPMIRYFGNMCTFSYSFAWWDWEQWEPFIDWLALNGFNTVLMPLGQEAIWRDVFLSLGVSSTSLGEFFTSPAYSAWGRMGNLKRWSNGTSDARMDRELRLARRIVARLVELGIVPVLPMFAGFVPDQMQKLFPKSNFTRNSCWNGFNRTFSCVLSVAATDPLFQRISFAFFQAQATSFGDVTHMFSADVFNELTPHLDRKKLQQTSAAFSRACQSFDPLCIWVIQSWQFTYKNWPTWAVKSFMSGVPTGHLLVLDLQAELEPAWQKFASFHGHHFVWCLLHNFGGSRELRGNIRNIDKAYQLALNTQPNLAGGGLAMEAIGQNYIIYQFMIDRIWSKQVIDIAQWLKSFVDSRYGGSVKVAHKVWSLMVQTIYSEPIDGSRFAVFLYYRPEFGKRLTYWFDSNLFEKMASALMQIESQLSHNPLFREDSADLLRATQQLRIANEIVLPLYEAFAVDDKSQLATSCAELSDAFVTLDQLGAHSVQAWIEAARSTGSNDYEKRQTEQDARDLLTTWGPDGQNLDYAHREWAGLIRDYYAQRWSFFCDWIVANDCFNRSAFEEAIFERVERVYTLPTQ